MSYPHYGPCSDLQDEDPDMVRFVVEVVKEVVRAKNKFPKPDGLMAALTEETGEVAQAMMDEPKANVRTECVQVAAMACRIALEGDPTLDGIRKQRNSDA